MQLPAQHVVPLALQSSVQAMHAGESGAAQVPPQQLSPAAHEMAQPPHCAALVRVSTHVPPQHWNPGAHALPHIPQLVSSLIVSMQSPSQQPRSPQPLPHSPQCIRLASRSTQVPAQQARPSPHALPHAPQFDSSVLRSKPSSIVPLQSLSSPSHTSGDASGPKHSSEPPAQVRVPLRQTPTSPATVHGSPTPVTSSIAPSQSSSRSLQVSVTGVTAPSHAPKRIDVASHVCVPITQTPIPAVPIGPP
jgi:hypothetical protein